MNRNELQQRIISALVDFTAEEEVWGDDAQICVNPDTHAVTLAADVDEHPAEDCYSVMEFLQPSPANPGEWAVDPEAVEALVSEYFPG